jgi:hypothetical protein
MHPPRRDAIGVQNKIKFSERVKLQAIIPLCFTLKNLLFLSINAMMKILSSSVQKYLFMVFRLKRGAGF